MSGYKLGEATSYSLRSLLEYIKQAEQDLAMVHVGVPDSSHEEEGKNKNVKHAVDVKSLVPQTNLYHGTRSLM